MINLSKNKEWVSTFLDPGARFMNIGKYEILAELGKGGFGVVYKARDVTLDRIVALKVLHAQLTVDERFVQYFEREACSLAKIDHPNVVTIHEIGNYKGQVYIAMRYLSGGSLSEKIRREGALSQQEAFRILNQVGKGLMAGHNQGIIHRDVKPGNILFDEIGQTVVADFSLAKTVQMSTSVASTGSLGFAGTPSYMPPEMWDGGVITPAVDQYSLACVLYEMLSGRRLFEGETTAKIMHSHFTPLTLPNLIPTGLRAILGKALAFNPENRFSSIDEFLQAIAAYEKNERLYAQTPEVKTIIEPNPYLTEGLNYPNRNRPNADPEKPVQSKRLPSSMYWMIGGAILIIVPAYFLIRGNFSSSLLPDQIEAPAVMPTEALTDFEEPTPAPSVPPTNTSAPTATITPIPAAEEIGTRIRKLDNMEQVIVPAGTFRMGSDFDEERERPEHLVWLDDYWIDVFEVTNSQYAMCVSENACKAPDYRDSVTHNVYFSNPEFNDYPVIYVSWQDAANYCNWVRGRLPTEAEWEKAARGDEDARIFPWGNNFASHYANLCDRNCTQDWKNDNFDDGFSDTAPVTAFAAGVSPYGVMNMAGNICEWVADWYQADYFYNKQDWSEPIGPGNGTLRVIKGGSWYDDTDILRVSARYGFPPAKSYYDVGFRCVNEP